jgi:hypothetical protein
MRSGSELLLEPRRAILANRQKTISQARTPAVFGERLTDSFRNRNRNLPNFAAVDSFRRDGGGD